eukprot:1586742-Amphidinium_carterae.1
MSNQGRLCCLRRVVWYGITQRTQLGREVVWHKAECPTRGRLSGIRQNVQPGDVVWHKAEGCLA